jgi:Skp family chaperone for outer membrane proteins
MNKMSLVLLVAGCGIMAGAFAETPSISQLASKSNLNIRFIDSLEVMRMSKGGQEAQKELETRRDQLAKEIQSDEQKFNQAATEFKSKAPALSETARDKEEKRLVKMKRDFETKVQESEEEIKMAMQRVTERLARDVEEAVTSVAKEDGLDAVVDTMTGRVIYVANGINITGKITSKVNVKHTQMAQNKSADSKKTVA